MLQSHSLQVSGWSQQGRFRLANGDAWAAYVPPEPERQRRQGALVAVAEGYARDGRELPWLSARALEALGQSFFAVPAGDKVALLMGAVQVANQTVQAWRSHLGWHGAFAGIVAAAATPDEAALAQVGDGQAFLVRGGQVWPLFQWPGHGGAGGAWGPRGRRILDTALGWMPQVPVRLTRFGVLPGDQVLICSGGFTAGLPAWAGWTALPSPADMVQAVDDGGGQHNRTVVVLQVPRAWPVVQPVARARAAAAQVSTARADWQPVLEVLGPVALAGGLAALLLALASR